MKDSKRYTLSWMQRGLKSKDYYSVNSGVFAGDNETIEYYNKDLKILKNNTDSNIIISTDEMTEWAYTFLFFTGEKTYFMQDFYGQTFSVDKKYYGEGLDKINVDNSIIIHIPPRVEKFNKILPLKELENICVSTNIGEADNEFVYSTFSKKSYSGTLEITFSVESERTDLPKSFNLIINNEIYEAIYDEDLQSYTTKPISIKTPKGYTEINIKTNYIIENKDVTLSIKSTELTIIKE